MNGGTFDSQNDQSYISSDKGYYSPWWNVTVFSGASRSLTQEIALPYNASCGVRESYSAAPGALDPSNHRLYVPTDDCYLAVIDTTRNMVSNVVNFSFFGSGSGPVLYDPSNGDVYLDSGSGGAFGTGAFIMNTSTNSVIGTTPFPLGGGVYSGLNGNVYFAGSITAGMNQLVEVSSSTGRVVQAINITYLPRYLTLNSVTGYIYAIQSSGSVIVIDPSSNSIVGTFTFAGGGEDPVFDGATNSLYLIVNDNVSVVNMTSHTTLGWDWLGAQLTPYFVIFDSADQTVCVLSGPPAAEWADTITVLDGGPTTWSLLTSVSIVPSPATVQSGMGLTLTAQPVCSPSPCPAYSPPTGVTYQWQVNNTAYGSLSTETGPATTFSAGSIHVTVRLTLTASEYWLTASTTVVITIATPPASPPPYLLISSLAAVVMAVVVVVVVLFRRSRRRRAGASARADLEPGDSKREGALRSSLEEVSEDPGASRAGSEAATRGQRPPVA